MQVFVTNPRGWAPSPGDPRQDERLRTGLAEDRILLFLHAPYLVNLGSPTPTTVERSAAALQHSLRRGSAIGARAVVFHAGSAVDSTDPALALARVREALLPILDNARAEGLPRLLVEPSAGGGRGLAARVGDLPRYLDAMERHPWLGVCLDTCHAWAAGHDIATPGGMRTLLDDLVAAIGNDRLELVHANDSRDACGSNRDRHANIGAGLIGEAPFAELLAHPAVRGVPIIVETPNDTGEGHPVDIATLRRLRDAGRDGAAPTSAVIDDAGPDGADAQPSNAERTSTA